MKIKLKDGTTITDIANIEYIIDVENGYKSELKLYFDYSSGINGDKVVEYNNTIGFDKYSILTDSDVVIENILNPLKLYMIYESFMNDNKVLVAAFK